MNIYVDIDDTICYYNGERSYPDAIPIKERIDKITALYDDGNTIVFWTARGGSTGIDWTELTRKHLNEWGAKHHELKMWKPSYDLFICDKVINTERFFNENR